MRILEFKWQLFFEIIKLKRELKAKTLLLELFVKSWNNPEKAGNEYSFCTCFLSGKSKTFLENSSKF